MIQFNLLPDVKLKYIKAQRLKQTVSVVASITAGALLIIFILLYLTTNIVQKNHINNLNKQIVTLTNQLQNTPNLTTVLTVQDAVNALPNLNSQKPVVTRLGGYVSSITPAKATISQLNVNFSAGSISISGQADTLATINLFVDTLKEATYQTTPTAPAINVFSNVILSSFAYSSTAGASYTITANFDHAIFAQSNSSVTLAIPTTTVNHNGSNSALFQTQALGSGN